MMRHVFCITGFIVLLSACGVTDDKKQAVEALLVKGALVKEEVMGVPADFSFISKPYRASDLSFRVGGLIVGLEVHAGTYYRKGEVIAKLDSRDFVIQKERTEALYHQAKTEFERIETLYKKENLSASMYEKARAEFVSAKTAFQTASNQLDDTQLKAPFDGYVGLVYAEKHQEVKASQPILCFEDINRLKIEVYVPQGLALKADSLKSIPIVWDAKTDKAYVAQIEQVSKSTTGHHLSYLITAVLPNPDQALLAGMSGKALFSAQGGEEAKWRTIPGSALCYNPEEGNYVWVIDSSAGRASKRNIEIGQLMKGGDLQVISGLQAGETVSVSGNRFLFDGCSVQVSNR